MGTDTPSHGSPRPPRPAGKKLPERRQGFLIYLPQATHAKLKAEATRRVITMSELVLTAVAQYLAVEPAEVGPPPERQPFIGQYGAGRPVIVPPPVAGPETADAGQTEQGTFEVEE